LRGWFGAIALIIAVFLLIQLVGNRQQKRIAVALRARRPNLTREEFVALLADATDTGAAEFLWEELLPYWKPNLTPHPDDDFLKDLLIDDEEPEDWLKRYCDRFGHDWRSWPPWAAEQPTTVRNFARWLTNGRPARTTA